MSIIYIYLSLSLSLSLSLCQKNVSMNIFIHFTQSIYSKLAQLFLFIDITFYAFMAYNWLTVSSYRS